MANCEPDGKKKNTARGQRKKCPSVIVRKNVLALVVLLNEKKCSCIGGVTGRKEYPCIGGVTGKNKYPYVSGRKNCPCIIVNGRVKKK